MTPDPKPIADVTDVALMRCVQKDDDCAFAELYRRYYRRVLGFYYGMCGDEDAARDLCQEVFLRVWKIRRRYAATGSFPAYLFGIARMIWLERLREILKRQRHETSFNNELQWLEPTASTSSRPDVMGENAEMRQRIFEALEKLPEEQRMAFVLRTVQGMPLEDIAAVMRCPLNTVRSRRIQAIQKLRETLRGIFVI